MPRAKPIEAYPLPSFMGLYTRIATTRESLIIPCTPPQAASMRGELYAFRRACEMSPAAAQSLGVDVAILREVSFRVKPEGLEACHQSTLTTPSLINAALGGAVAPIKTPAQKALEALQALGVGVTAGAK